MPMTLRLTPSETEALRETARRERRSMQAVARAAIDEYVTTHDELPETLEDVGLEAWEGNVIGMRLQAFSKSVPSFASRSRTGVAALASG